MLGGRLPRSDAAKSHQAPTQLTVVAVGYKMLEWLEHNLRLSDAHLANLALPMANI